MLRHAVGILLSAVSKLRVSHERTLRIISGKSIRRSLTSVARIHAPPYRNFQRDMTCTRCKRTLNGRLKGIGVVAEKFRREGVFVNSFI